MITEKKIEKEMELASMLASRLCHDLVGPISAAANGMEMAVECDFENTRREAVQLSARAVAQSLSRIRIARLALGAGGSAALELSIEEVIELLTPLAEDKKSSIRWTGGDITLAKEKARLLLNLGLMVLSGMSENGKISMREEEGGILVNARNMSLPSIQRLQEIVKQYKSAPLTPDSVQNIYACHIAESLGLKVTIRADEEAKIVILEALP
ncbi:MAG: histidine phosphotransferase family protein [Parvibaculales bacterium]